MLNTIDILTIKKISKSKSIHKENQKETKVVHSKILTNHKKKGSNREIERQRV